MPNAFGINDDRYEIAKAERSSGNPSMGRRATNAAFGTYHAVAVSPKGRRFKNGARDYGSGVAGAAPGAALYGIGSAKMARTGKGAGLALGGAAAALGGGIAARQANLTSMNRKGYLKKEEK